MRALIFILIALSCCYYGYSQITSTNGYVVQNLNDSLQIQSKLNYVRIVNKDSTVLEEYGTRNGHYWLRNKEGSYIKRNSKGKLVEIGHFQWNIKVGKWLYFF